MLSKRYKSTEVDRRTWLHVPSGTPWSTEVIVVLDPDYDESYKAFLYL